MTYMELDIENIGGIDEVTVAFDKGVTLIQSPNATNKTSLLEGVLFPIGTSPPSIKSGADVGRVRLRLGDQTIERTARRRGKRIETDGEMLIEAPDNRLLFGRFAALLGDNPLRVAIATDQDIESLLKEPMDIESLEAERAHLMERKRDCQARLEKLTGVNDRLDERERELDETRAEVTDLEMTLKELEAEREETSENEALRRFRERRADLVSEETEHQNQVDQLQDAIDRLEARRHEMSEEIEQIDSEMDDVDVETLELERAEIESEMEDVERRLDVLQSVLTANREILGSEFTGVLGYEAGLMEDEITCWTCGNTAEREDVESTVNDLQDLIEKDKRRLGEREPEFAKLDEQIEAAKATRSRRQERISEQSDIEQRLEERHDSLAERQSQLGDVREKLQSLGEEIAEHESEQSDTDSKLSEAVESTRIELRTKREDVEQLENSCKDLREKQRERDDKQQRIEEFSEEIATLTNRIENLETELREVFNESMDELIQLLDFERIERVWLDGDFDLVVARESGGSVREDSVEHLAESEQEMIGLVLGLAGFVTYDVNEISPVLVLDSLGAFDVERTRRLIDYFAGRTDILLAAVHPESAKVNEHDVLTFDQPITETSAD